MSIRAIVTAVALVLAALFAQPASAAPSTVAAGPCENEVDIYKQGDTIVAYAVQYCEGKPPNQLFFRLEVQMCNQWGCGWATWKEARGSISVTCPGFAALFRNSKLPTKHVWC